MNHDTGGGDEPRPLDQLRDDPQAVGPFEAALDLARELAPGLDPSPYRERIRSLGARVDRSAGPSGSLQARLDALARVLFEEEGFRGNREAYYDPRNSRIDEVMDRKLGIPITLSVVTIAVGRAAGLILHGVNTPAHFLVRWDDPESPGSAGLIDPFTGVVRIALTDVEEHIRSATGQSVLVGPDELIPATPRQIVVRMLRNLKAIYRMRGEAQQQFTVQRRLASLAWDEPWERRDLGLAALEVERGGIALDAFLAYLDAVPEAPDRDQVAGWISIARTLIARAN